jgi:nicotinamidase-related amidase
MAGGPGGMRVARWQARATDLRMPPPPSPRRRPQRRGLIEQHGRHASALLILDMISCWDFPDAAPLARAAAPVAAHIAALKRRCAAAKVPVIYANDNSGQWRSDFKFVVRASLESNGPGADITRLLQPGDEDYFVLKPKHSAFFATPLEILLDHLKTERLIVTGVAADQCVANTVADARMRDFDAVVPADCVATQSETRLRNALRHFEEVLDVRTTPGRHLRFPSGRR